MSISLNETPSLSAFIAQLIAELESVMTAEQALGIIEAHRERLVRDYL